VMLQYGTLTPTTNGKKRADETEATPVVSG
jgi:hypothetical protein